MIEVWFDHKVIGTHDPQSTVQQAREGARAGDLMFIEPDGTVTEYAHGEWHAWGTGIPCAWINPSADCENCNAVTSRG